MSEKVDLLLAKRRLSYRVAESVVEIMKHGESQHEQVRIDGKLDEVAQTIYAVVPLTMAEAELEYQRARAVETDLANTPGTPTKPGLFDRLRETLDYDKSVSLKGTMEGAIEFITKHRRKGCGSKKSSAAPRSNASSSDSSPAPLSSAASTPGGSGNS